MPMQHPGGGMLRGPQQQNPMYTINPNINPSPQMVQVSSPAMIMPGQSPIPGKYLHLGAKFFER